MDGLCTSCYQRVKFMVCIEGAWRVMTCPKCGQEYREPAGKQQPPDRKEHRKEKPESWR